MNKVILLGRLSRDPEVRTTQNGMTIARMNIAVNRMGKKQEGRPTADFIGLTAWDKTAEFAGQYLAKGRQILVEGRIQVSNYEQDGKKLYRTDVIADRIEFADSKPQGGEKETSPQDLPFF